MREMIPRDESDDHSAVLELRAGKNKHNSTIRYTYMCNVPR